MKIQFAPRTVLLNLLRIPIRNCHPPDAFPNLLSVMAPEANFLLSGVVAAAFPLVTLCT